MSRMPETKAPLSAEQFLAVAGDLPNAELWGGAILVREPAGFYASRVNLLLARRVAEFVEARALGHVGESSAGFVVRRDPDRVLAPDVSFVHAGRPVPREGFLEGAPDFVVEVRSPRDSWEATLARGGIWLGHEVGLVWLVDSTRPRAVELRLDEAPVVHGPDGVLRGDPILPGLAVPLSSLGIEAAAS